MTDPIDNPCGTTRIVYSTVTTNSPPGTTDADLAWVLPPGTFVIGPGGGGGVQGEPDLSRSSSGLAFPAAPGATPANINDVIIPHLVSLVVNYSFEIPWCFQDLETFVTLGGDSFVFARLCGTTSQPPGQSFAGPVGDNYLFIDTILDLNTDTYSALTYEINGIIPHPEEQVTEVSFNVDHFILGWNLNCCVAPVVPIEGGIYVNHGTKGVPDWRRHPVYENHGLSGSPDWRRRPVYQRDISSWTRRG
jgi:hypothetical protein